MTVGSAQFAELLWPGISAIWQDSYNEWDPKYSQFFYKKDSDKAFEKEQGVIGLPLAGIKDQGEQIPMVDPMQGYQKEYVNVTYALGSSVTREMYEDDQYNVINNIPKYLARSLRQTEEVVHHDILNNGFSSVTAGDGLTVFNTAHTMLGTGSTLSNMGQSGVTYALSQTSLEQALIFISNWTDDQDLKIAYQGRMLVVPTNLQFTAEKILGTEFEVNTANNTINPVRGKMPHVVTPWITDTDSWFIVTDVTKEQGTGLVCYERRAAEIQRDSDFNTQNMLFSTTKRWSAGVTDFRGVWGSQGA